MAAKNVRPTSTKAGERGERTNIALNAAWELESIAEALIQQSRSLSAEDLVIRSLSIRARDLAGVLIGALDDALHAPADLRDRLTGIREQGGAVKEAAYD